MSQIKRVYLDQALVKAAFYGDTAVVCALLALGADPHINNEEALREAACYGREETARVLVKEGGADVGKALSFSATVGLDWTTEALLRIFPAHPACKNLRQAFENIAKRPKGIKPDLGPWYMPDP